MSTSQWTVLLHFHTFQLLANPPTCIAALYANSKTGIASKCSLQIWKTTTPNLPAQITPDVCILTTLVTAPINTITLICPEKPMKTIPIWHKYTYWSYLQPAVPPHHICTYPLGMKPPFWMSMYPSIWQYYSHDKYFCTAFSHMATLRKQ